MRAKVELLKKEEIMKSMQVRYTKYYRHWKDFDLLTCILAMIGLFMAIFDYEVSYTIQLSNLHLGILQLRHTPKPTRQEHRKDSRQFGDPHGYHIITFQDLALHLLDGLQEF